MGRNVVYRLGTKNNNPTLLGHSESLGALLQIHGQARLRSYSEIHRHCFRVVPEPVAHEDTAVSNLSDLV